MAAAADSQAAALREEITTRAPCSAKRSAMARPMPREDPVMTAVRPLRSKSRMGQAAWNVRLRHGEGGANLALEQRSQPLAPLRLAGKQMQQLHVSRVGGAAVEDLRSPWHPPHQLRERSIFEMGEPRTGFFIA